MAETDRTQGSCSPPGSLPARGGRPPPKAWLFAASQRAVLVVFAALVLHAPLHLPSPAASPPRTPEQALQHTAGGARWLESYNQEVVHFVCEAGAPYRVSLMSASLSAAGVPPEERGAYLHALEEAVDDWRSILRCPRIRAEMDSPDAETQILFAFIDNPSTLAMGTRAQHIVLNSARAWFPGSKEKGNFNGRDRAASFYWVVAHELGHVWGIAHSESPSSLMYPSQCETCRWSSYEQAAGNLIHAANLVPHWSRPHYANRFFVKTPLAVVKRLLTGELPEEPLWSIAPEHGSEEHCAAIPDEGWDKTFAALPELTPRSSLVGASAARHLWRTDHRRQEARMAPDQGTDATERPADLPGSPSSADLPRELPPALPPRWSTPSTEAWLLGTWHVALPASCLSFLSLAEKARPEV